MNRKTTVVHIGVEPYDICIDRTTIYGNPFIIGIDGNRHECIEKYKIWIQKSEQKELLEKLYKLDGKTLGCWCVPEKCHGHVIIELIEKHKNKIMIDKLL